MDHHNASNKPRQRSSDLHRIPRCDSHKRLNYDGYPTTHPTNGDKPLCLASPFTKSSSSKSNASDVCTEPAWSASRLRNSTNCMVSDEIEKFNNLHGTPRLRCHSWDGQPQDEEKRKSKEQPPDMVYDTKTYGGRVTYGQWRQLFKNRRAKSRDKKVDAIGRPVRGQKEFDLQKARERSESAGRVMNYVEYLRPEIWLLVLLMSDAAAMGSIASSCKSISMASLPWQQGGSTTTSKPDSRMRVSFLAARLRCGIQLAEEILGLNHAICYPPERCRSWLDMLWQQESSGRWLCLISSQSRTEAVEDFVKAVQVAQRWCPTGIDTDGESLRIIVLPSVYTHHVSERIPVVLKLPIRVVGMPLPFLHAQNEATPSLRHSFKEEPSTRWKTIWPKLSLKSLEVAVQTGRAELRNIVLVGQGTNESKPQGVCDSVLRITKGECMLVDCQVNIEDGRAGHGVVVGPKFGQRFPTGAAPRLTISRTEILNATTGILAHFGGQVVIEENCAIYHCKTGIQACDDGTNVFVPASLKILSRHVGRHHDQVGGGVIQRQLRRQITSANQLSTVSDVFGPAPEDNFRTRERASSSDDLSSLGANGVRGGWSSPNQSYQRSSPLTRLPRQGEWGRFQL